MFVIDEDRVFEEINRRKAKRIVFNAPDGLLNKVQALAKKLEDIYNIDAIVIADPCYGSCDTVDDDALRLKADVVFHVGHKISLSNLGKRTIFIDAYDDISFKEVLEKALPLIKSKRVGLCTISQHIHSLKEAKEFLEKNGIEVLIGEGKGQLLDGQIFGCEFYPVFGIKDEVDLFLFLGQSRFHALGVALSTNKTTLMLDPYLKEVEDVTSLANERIKRALFAVYKALDAESFGVIIGLKEGQINLLRAFQIRDKLKNLGKKVSLIALREVREDRLLLFKDIEVFIQTACPRISIDDYHEKLVLSAPQADALINLLEGKSVDEFLIRPHWL
ncbi:MAG: diphthamide biosynthesis enzyme Dph2 [Nitrososphaerales archaeon]